MNIPPCDGKVLKDKSGARQMAGRTDDLSTAPAMLGHDALAVEDILNRVLSLTFFNDRAGRDTLCDGEQCHDVRFDKLIVCGTASQDKGRSYS